MATFKELANRDGFEPEDQVREEVCTKCKGHHGPAFMELWGYCESDLYLCPNCAAQMLRHLAEDLCSLTPGGRHG